jgi:hypothetical protein
VVAHVRIVKTALGAVAVQIVGSSRRGTRSIERVGSAHDDAQVEVLKAAARRRVVEGQGELDLGLDPIETASVPVKNPGSQAGYLWDALCLTYEVLGLGGAAGGDEVFRDLVCAHIIEPTSSSPPVRRARCGCCGG